MYAFGLEFIYRPKTMHSTDNPKGCLGSTKMGVGITRHILFGQMGGHGNKRSRQYFCVWPPIRPLTPLTSSKEKPSRCNNHSMQRWGWFEIFFELSALHLGSQISQIIRVIPIGLCAYDTMEMTICFNFLIPTTLLHPLLVFSIYITTQIFSLWCFISLPTYLLWKKQVC